MVLRHLAAALLALTLLAGCSDDDSGSATDAGSSDEPTPTATDSPTRPDDPQCPGGLPMGEGTDLGLGTEEPADAPPPAFDTPTAAWVCPYALDDEVTSADTEARWVGDGPGRFVPEGRLPALTESLSELTPAEAARTCSLDLGGRLLLVLPREDGLTGIVVDDFGCGDVRMTDDPYSTTALGEKDGDGTVAGVLTGPPSLHAILEVVVPR